MNDGEGRVGIINLRVFICKPGNLCRKVEERNWQEIFTIYNILQVWDVCPYVDFCVPCLASSGPPFSPSLMGPRPLWCVKPDFSRKFPPYLPFMCLSCCCCICVFEQWRHCFTNLRLLSGAPSLVEVRQLFLLQYFADFPHTRVNMFALQNSTNTTKNFQNTNYPFTSHSIRERSPKVSIWSFLRLYRSYLSDP